MPAFIPLPCILHYRPINLLLSINVLTRSTVMQNGQKKDQKPLAPHARVKILCHDRHHPVPILSETVLLASLYVLKRPASFQRPQAFYDRSKPFYSALKLPFNFLTVLSISKAFYSIFKYYNFDRFMTFLDRSYLLGCLRML